MDGPDLPIRKARAIAFYLPQYHPIPENDLAWGPGFTEWTNVKKAKPLFRGHYQPRLPGELGYYNLLDPEVREKQARLAQAHGIEGFCYWHYWLGNGKRLLEKPLNAVLRSGRPDFPFCLAWANHTWNKRWYGSPEKVIAEQTYPGRADEIAHFMTVREAFKDKRYITVHGKPLFVVFKPFELPDPQRFCDLWRTLALENGLPGLYLVGIIHKPFPRPEAYGFDGFAVSREAAMVGGTPRNPLKRLLRVPRIARLYRKWAKRPIDIYSYREAMKYFLPPPETRPDAPGGGVPNYFPSVIHDFDNTPRSGIQGYILRGASPALFRRLMQQAVEYVSAKPSQEKLVFLKSWNEWAEGNYLEPDAIFGTRYLEAIREELKTV